MPLIVNESTKSTLPSTVQESINAGAPVIALNNGAIFSRFDVENDVINNSKETVSTTCWSDSLESLSSFYTSSAEIALSSSHYYWNVYHTENATTSGSPQFAIAYGHVSGAGSVTGSLAGYNGNLTSSRTPSRAIYSQYASLLLDPGTTRFTFGSVTPNDIIVINFNRARYKEKLDIGNWQLKIQMSGSMPITLIDNSGASVDPSIGASGRVFNIVSGSISAGTASDGSIFGLCYPDVGLLVLDANKINISGSLGLITSSFINPFTTSSNLKKIFTAVSGGASFQARSEEIINSTYYYVRARNKDFNYSNNPSFITGSVGLIRLAAFVQDPKVYVTSIGLYNDNNELLAVAKLSRPLLKDFVHEALIRVKLDF